MKRSTEQSLEQVKAMVLRAMDDSHISHYSQLLSVRIMGRIIVRIKQTRRPINYIGNQLWLTLHVCECPRFSHGVSSSDACGVLSRIDCMLLRWNVGMYHPVRHCESKGN